MYGAIQIQNFRGFDTLQVGDLSRVNLVVGKNNMGKTGVLEAIHLLTSVGNFSAIRRLNSLRGITFGRRAVGEQYWPSLFHRFDWHNAIKVLATLDSSPRTDAFELRLSPAIDSEEETTRELEFGDDADTAEMVDSSLARRSLSMEMVWHRADREPVVIRARDASRASSVDSYRVSSAPSTAGRSDEPGSVFLPTSRIPYQTEAERYKIVVQQGRKQELLDALKVIDGRIDGIELLPLADDTALHVDVGLRQMMPIGLFGEGSQRLVSLVLALTEAAGGVLLIDEVDTGLHYSVLQQMWRIIGEAARRLHVQVFASTHSYECMVAAYEAFTERPRDFSLHRLEREGHVVRCVSLDHRVLGLALHSSSEVR
jgi:hypothetical protein